MFRLTAMFVLMMVVACGKGDRATPAKESGPAGSTNAHAKPTEAAPAQGAPAPSGDADAVAQLVLDDLASNAFGNQKVARPCVSVSPVVAAGTSAVASARLLDGDACGDKTARGMHWIFVRGADGAWKEDFLGPAPTCWKGVPAEIADAVAQASGIAKC